VISLLDEHRKENRDNPIKLDYNIDVTDRQQNREYLIAYLKELITKLKKAVIWLPYFT
jgi:hypothetical protein